MAVEWRAVPDWVGFYQVSDTGEVRSVDRVVVDRRGRPMPLKGRVLRPNIRSDGYRIYRLCKNGTSWDQSSHLLVMAAFVGPRPEGMQCRHLNGDPSDNRLANLQYGTVSENTYDAVLHGTHPQARKTRCKRGHPLANARISPCGRRVCRVCHREYQKQWRRQRAVAA